MENKKLKWFDLPNTIKAVDQATNVFKETLIFNDKSFTQNELIEVISVEKGKIVAPTTLILYQNLDELYTEPLSFTLTNTDTSENSLSISFQLLLGQDPPYKGFQVANYDGTFRQATNTLKIYPNGNYAGGKGKVSLTVFYAIIDE